MIEKLVNNILNKIKEKNPNLTELEKDRIWFGLMILFDEIPKLILLSLITWYFGVINLMLISFISFSIYRLFSGGIHLKSHIGCFIMSFVVFVGTPIISKYVTWDNNILKYFIFTMIWIYNMLMIRLYAPADTEAVPIINKQQRKQQKIMSYITMNIVFIIGLLFKNNMVTNTLIFSTFIQSFNISRIAYKLFKNKYGHEELAKEVVTQI